MIIQRFCAVLSILLLGACQTTGFAPAPQKTAEQIRAEQLKAEQDWFHFADTTCTSYGFSRISTEYKQCRMQLDIARRNQMIQRRQAMEAAMFGFLLQQAAPGPPRTYQPYPTVTLPQGPPLTYRRLD